MSALSSEQFQHSGGGTMIRVPAGSFTMGSPESEEGHRIWEHQCEWFLPYDYFLGQTPVTQAEFEAITGTNPTDHDEVPDAPMDSLNWDQASEFCEQLTEIDRETGVLPDDWEYRLPTEAEWEYACRAGSLQPRHGDPSDVAWYYDNADARPHPVGQKAPNAWGFHDMLGNIWEWCQDWFLKANPCRSARGGSYFNSARFCRSAQRWGWNPKSRGRYSGLRLLAAESGSFDLSSPVDEFPQEDERPPSIYDAIQSNDFDLAQQVVNDNPNAVESVDGIPPPLHNCIYANNLDMLEWLLDHGADIERREQDYGATPLNCAVVMRQKEIIRALVERGAETANAMECALRGLAGEFEYDPTLDRDGYQEIVELLQSLDIDSTEDPD